MQTMKVNRCVHCMKDLQDEYASICPCCGKPPQTVEQPSYCLKPFSILRGKYLVGRMLGQGGFGITYVGWDLVLDTKVAIKECYPANTAARDNNTSNRLQWNTSMAHGESWKDACENFLKEARKMAKMKDIPEVVRVQDTFEENNTAYIVMEFIEGVTLKQWLEQRGILPYRDCIKMVRPLIAALENLHQQGFIHRDISPDNIMIQPDGRLRLLDMGTAKELTPQNSNMSQLVTKRGFSPVEQYMETGRIGPWTDVYAICATIYYCITGQTVPSALDRLDNDTLVFPSNLKEPLSSAAETALRAGLAVDAKSRIQSAGELIQRLESEGPKPTPAPSAKKPVKKWLPIAGGAAAALIMIIAAVFSSSGGPDGSGLDATPTPKATQESAAAEPVRVEQLGTSNANLFSYGGFAQIPNKYDYFISADGGLYICPYDEEDSIFYLGDSKKVCGSVCYITLGSNQVYFIQISGGTDSICAMNPDGSGLTTLYPAPDGSAFWNLQYASFSDGREYLYFWQTDETNSDQSAVCRYDLRSDTVETVVEGDLWWYNLYGDSLYYTETISEDTSSTRLVRAGLDGENVETLNSDKGLTSGFIEDDAIYLYSYKDETLLVYGLDGSSDSSFSGFYDINMDLNLAIGYGDGWLYYTNLEDESLHRVRANGTGDTVLLEGHTAWFLCYAQSWLWFMEDAPTGTDYQRATQAYFISKSGDTLLYAQDPDVYWTLTTASAQDFQYTDSTDGSGVAITGYTGALTEFQIPGTIDGKPVVEIGESAFTGSEITKIALPEGVRTIDESAFYQCGSLTFAGLPEGLEEIGFYAFFQCENLTAVYLPESLMSIGDQAFALTRLSEVYIPANVEYVGPAAFAVYADAGLKEINVSEDNPIYASLGGVLFSVGEYGIILEAFPSGLTGAYTIPDWTDMIQNYAFCYSQLDNVTIPESVYAIGYGVFLYSSVTSITVSEDCTLPEDLGGDITVQYYSN